MGTKYLYLIRHGQFNDLREQNTLLPEWEKWIEKLTLYDGGLSEKGIKQAKLTAQRMSFYPIDKIFSSTLPRAKETAKYIADAYLKKELIIDEVPELMECLPWATLERSDFWGDGMTLEEINTHRNHADSAYDRFFTPANGENDEHEVLVCHGNIIRYLITRVIGMQTDYWVNFGTNYCGLSLITIDSKGIMLLKSLNDTGHIPIDL